jgi:predicted RNase H-like nuclease (RuvC/YqgF family)
MRYDLEIDVEDLGISTEDLISLAEDNGDRLYDEDDLECRIEEEVANAIEDAKDTIKSLEEEVARLTNDINGVIRRNEELNAENHSLRNDGFIEKTKTTIAALEKEIASLNAKPAVDVDDIARFVLTALRVEAVGIADCIRRGDYGV